ncbi:flagellar basal body protein, partial [Borreliella garinii]
MVRGIYTAASGMMAERRKLDVVSNNLANIDLVGYKKDLSIQKAFPE